MPHRTTILASAALAAVIAVAQGPLPAQAATKSHHTTRSHPTKAIVVGTEGTYAPFDFHDASNGLTGYDVAVFKAVAAKAGYAVKFEETNWDSLFAGLDAGRWAAIADEVTITPARQAKYDFTTPYSVSHYVVVTRTGDNRVKAVADIKGLTAAQSATSSFATQAQTYGATVQTVDGFTQAVALLQLGRVDVTLNDQLAVLDYLKANRDAGIRIAATFGGPTLQGFVFRKHSGYAAAFDKALTALERNGTIARIGKQYFGHDISHA